MDQAMERTFDSSLIEDMLNISGMYICQRCHI